MIYLDSAATTLQKPPAVQRAVSYAIGHIASPGRGGHQPAMLAAETAFSCRQVAAELFHVPNSEQVVFTHNATHAINLAIKSLVQPEDTVLISGYEHNAVTRPLYALGAKVKVAESPLFRPDILYDNFARLLTQEVSCVITTHVSNVFGYILPVERMANLCRERGVPFILDASQSAGTLPVHMENLGASFIAMPGHKGLYGPQGTGLLLCGGHTLPLIEGGTGSGSALQEMPSFLPDRLEAGTHNICGIAGLLEGLTYVSRVGVGHIHDYERDLMAQAAGGLAVTQGIWAYTDHGEGHQSGVLSFHLRDIDCEVVAHTLGEQGIAVRAGLHCAPLAHKTGGTFETGTVRASFSAFNTSREVDRFLRAVTRLANL